jgi:predicted RNA polymerase sigma factor
LAQTTQSPIVRLNQAVAISMAHGPQAGLDLVDALASDPALATYPYLPTARGDFLERLGRLNEARAEFERAASLTKNSRERALLLARAHTCAVATGNDA